MISLNFLKQGFSPVLQLLFQGYQGVTNLRFYIGSKLISHRIKKVV